MLLESAYNETDNPSIAGLVSLNYRLSPHPDYPAPPSDPARNARHPDHINDILAAITHLQSLYPHLKDNYILAGHSCGATLSLQVAMSQATRPPLPHSGSGNKDNGTKPYPPLAIVGIEGIYDLPALVAYHTAHPIYETFAIGAFGPDREVWKDVSPTNGRFNESWSGGRLVLLGHSREDELVEWEQVELMEASLRKQGFGDGVGKQRVLEVLQLEGLHHGGWQKGGEVVKAIERALEILAKTEQS